MKKLKLTLIGDYNVGKTSILNAYLDKDVYNTKSTLGIDFFTKVIFVNDDQYNMTCWDTAGSERFHSLTQTYIRDSDIVILVYDCGLRTSRINYWMRKVEQSKPKIVGILGSKDDLTNVFREDIYELVEPWTRQNWKIITGKCSSRNPKSVKDFFQECIKIATQNNTQNIMKIPNISLEPPKNKNRTCCT